MNAPVRATTDAARRHMALERRCFEEYRTLLSSVAQCDALEPVFGAAEIHEERAMIDAAAIAQLRGKRRKDSRGHRGSTAIQQSLLENGSSALVGAPAPPSLRPGPKLNSYMKEHGLANVYQFFVALVRLPARSQAWSMYPCVIRNLEEMQERCATFRTMDEVRTWLEMGNVAQALQSARQRLAAIAGRDVELSEVCAVADFIRERSAQELGFLCRDVPIGYVFKDVPVQGPVPVALPGKNFRNYFAMMSHLDAGDQLRDSILGERLSLQPEKPGAEPKVELIRPQEAPLANDMNAHRKQVDSTGSRIVSRRKHALGKKLPPLAQNDTRAMILDKLDWMEQELENRVHYMRSYCDPLFQIVVPERERTVLSLVDDRQDLLALLHHAAEALRQFLSDAERLRASALDAIVACRSAVAEMRASPSQIEVVLAGVIAFNDQISLFHARLASVCNHNEAVDRLWRATQTHVEKEVRLIADLHVDSDLLECGVRAREFQRHLPNVPKIARDALVALLRNAH